MLSKNMPTLRRGTPLIWPKTRRHELLDAWTLSMGREAAKLWLQAMLSRDICKSPI